MDSRKVTNKWQTEGDLAVLYKVGDLLLFYNKDKDPKFNFNQELTMEEAQSTRPYKAISFDIDSIPPDAIMDILFEIDNKKR